MSPQALIDAIAYIGGHDFTGDSNDLKFASDPASLQSTVFGSGGAHSYLGGLRDNAFDLSGFWASAASDAVDPEVFPVLGVADQVHTFGPAAVETSICYAMRAAPFSYKLGGPLGQLHPFSFASKGTNNEGAVKGQLAKAKGAVSATGQLGSVLNLGAPIAGQCVYATLHVFSAGTTITVQVQSDDSAGFATPTTRGTIGPITVRGGTWLTRIAGPFAGETHWRFNVSAITGAHVVAGMIAVQ